MTDTGKLMQFLRFVDRQKEAAMLILDTPEKQQKAEQVLGDHGYSRAADWKEIFSHLTQEKSAYIVLSDRLPKELYDTIVQYTDRQGMIQIMDKKTMEYKTIQFDPRTVHLLVVVLMQDIEQIEKTYPLRTHVGLMEIMT